MRQLKTSGGALVIEEGRLVLTEGEECLAQVVAQRLLTVRGEWRYDLTNGIPLLDKILEKTDIEVKRAIYRECLLETEGVVSVEALILTENRQARTLSVSGTVRAVNGSTVDFGPVRIDTPTDG